MRLRVHARLDEIPAADWDALAGSGNPFVSHAFLAGLEREGCIQSRNGWTPRHATLWRDDRLVAAAPGYLKANSHGEFVFDHAWVHAYARAGLDYFPKWLVAVPYSPVTGPRLLAVDDADRTALARGLAAQADADGLASVHVNFAPAAEAPAFGDDWVARLDVQFHWRNRDWADFGAFLAALQPKKRKNIRQERERVRHAGFRFRVVHGDEATEADLDAMYGFYVRTFAEYGNLPVLTLGFFRHLARAMPRRFVLILADLHGRTVAGALCLREGLAAFEPGAQGEHKIARGFLPTFTHSRHRVADPQFAAAIAGWCRRERAAAASYRDAVLAHSPYLDADPAAAAAR